MASFATILSAIKNISTLRIFLGPFIDYRVLGKTIPVLAGYKITHKCNLKCMHCPYWERSGLELDFEGVVTTLRTLKAMGVSILILEGGEPLLWKSGPKTITDVVSIAKTMFACVCITTNGTLPWSHVEADKVWVSLDGPLEIHNQMRGKGVFEKVWENLDKEGSGKALISTTINNINAANISNMVRMVFGRTAGVTIQFYYPYSGLPDPLFVPVDDRKRILDELIDLKLRGFPVANSFASLNDMKQVPWTCRDKLLANAEPDGTILHGCYLKNRGTSNCLLCGFSAHNEMSLAFEGCLDSIRTGLRIFFKV